MPSVAKAQFDVPLPPAEAGAASTRVLLELGYTLDEDVEPGDEEIVLHAKRTVERVERAGAARVAASETGSTIELGIDDAPGEPVGLLDGKHHRKLVAELEATIRRAVGSA